MSGSLLKMMAQRLAQTTSRLPATPATVARPSRGLVTRPLAQQQQQAQRGAGDAAQQAGETAVQHGRGGPSRGMVRRRRGADDRSTALAPLLAADLLPTPFPSFGRMGNFLTGIEDEMNSLFNILGGGTDVRVPANVPVLPVDIREDDKAFYFHVDLPGVNDDQVKIRITDDNVLTIEGERVDEHEEGDDKSGYRRVERSFGVFVRRFQLPENVDREHIKAELKRGQLDITVPKKESEPPKQEEKGKEVPINASS